MPSYKIHSIKDNKKLSFILEGENVSSLQKSLSNEGHIVLSVEPVDETNNKYFIFHGQKTDNSEIEGKIQADDIFHAYEMLIGDYRYKIDKLFPNNVTDSIKQAEIFTEIQAVYGKSSQKKVVVEKESTSDKKLIEFKKQIEDFEIFILASTFEEKDSAMLELRRISQMNNLSGAKQSYKTLLKSLIKKYDNNPSVIHSLKPFLSKAGVLILPRFLTMWMRNAKTGYKILSSLENNKIVTTEQEQKKSIQNYAILEKNDHINEFLQKKFRSRYGAIFSLTQKQSFFYTFWRKYQSLFFLRKLGLSFNKIISGTLTGLGALVCGTLFLDKRPEIVVNGFFLVLTCMIIVLTLVIRDETV